MAGDQGPGGGVRSAIIRKLSNLLNVSANLRVVNSWKAVSPTRFFVRYPHPKSLPSGKGLTIALVGSSYFINVDDNAEEYHSGGCRQYGDRPQ